MGGIYSSIAELAGSTIGKAFSKDAGSVVGKTAGQELIESGVYRGIFSEQRAFEQHPYAQKIYQDYQQHYKPKVNQYENHIAAAAQAKGQAPEMHEINRAASKQASKEVFGPNQERLQSMLKAVERDKGKNHADILSNHLQVMLKSAPIEEGPAKGRSLFDINMARGGLGNGARSYSAEAAPGFDAPLSPYRGRQGYETAIGKARATLAYKAAPIHMANATLNIASDSGLGNLFKTLGTIWGPGRQGAIAQLQHSDAISEFNLQEYTQHLEFQKSGVAKYAPGSVGEFIHKNMFIPGMSAVRRETILMAAHSGKLMAQEATSRLKAGDRQWALPALNQLGLDANKLTAQNFQLTADDIQKAYYHGANSKVFLDPYDRTPTFWRQSPLWRSTKAFSGYITKQNAFERDLILRQYRQGDFVGIARNLALKAAVYPVVGATLYELDRLLTGEDWDDPKKHYANRLEYTPAGMAYDLVAGRNNAVNTARTTINTLDMLARLGVWGATTGYIRGMNRANLAQHLLPPEVNVGVQLAQDMDKAAHTDGQHPDRWKPAARDVMAEVPYGAGSIASHYLLPTQKEQAAQKPHRFRLQKRPKGDSVNPLNNADFNY